MKFISKLLRAGLVVIAACSTEPKSAQTRQSLIGISSVMVVANAANEPYADYSPVGRPQLVTTDVDRSGSGAGFFGWASAIPTMPFLVCNGDLNNVLCASPVGKIPNHVSHKSNGGVASDGGKHVVLAELVNTGGDTHAERVAVYLSNNNGTAFFLPPSGEVNGSNCSGGTMDQVHVAFDLTESTPNFYVVWRHKDGGFYGGCFRKGMLVVDPMTLDATDVSWLTPAKDIGAMISEDSFSGQGGLLVQAGDGAMSVVYSTTGNIVDCPDTGHKGVGWEVVTTRNDGTNWTNSKRVFHSDNFVWCAFNAKMGKNFRDFSFVRAPDSGDYFVAVNDEKNSIRVFHSASQGWQWRQIHQIIVNDPGSDGGTAALSVLYPTLAVDGNGRLALFYYVSNGVNDMVGPPDTVSRPMIAACINPAAQTPAWQGPVPVSTFSTVVSADGGTINGTDPFRPWGDWAGMAVEGPNTRGCGHDGMFWPFWCEAMTGSPFSARIMTGRASVTP